jgi:hypothetical protein
VVVDTSNASIGIGIQGTEKPGSNLHVIGDASISSNLKLTTDTSITVNSNVVTDFNGPHAREPKGVPLKKYPEIAFDASKVDTFANSNAYTQAGYEISSTSRFSSDYDVLSAFNGTHLNDHFASQSLAYNQSSPYNYTLFTNNVTDKDSTQYTGEEIKVKIPQKIKLSKVHIVSYVGASGRKAASGHIFGSNTGANGSWTKLVDFTNLNTGTSGRETVSISTTEYYEWYSLVVTNLNGSDGLLNVYELEYYGYEEDPPAGDSSIDTTFKSVMNTPQTTGANVYVDAKLSSDFTNQVTGPTSVGTAATHDNTNKYWEMNGQLTSNITVEANTFLEGDQPHAVSVWFNSSNLEANVSNTCVFSVSDQEKLDSVNLDLQSNTWHNLTYAYQGEGGSRVTYLDGRKVSEDQAEDTFGDYPPFAMTGYSQGGYVASASSDIYSHTGFTAWKAFNNVTGNEGWHTGYNYLTTDTSQIQSAFIADAGGAITTTATATNLSNGTNRPAGGAVLSSSAGNIPGEWLKVELPHKIKLSYVKIRNRDLSNSNQCPKDFKILGSNDDDIWYELIVKQNAGYTADSTHNEPITNTQNGQNAYKYLAFLCTRINSTVDSSLTISEISYYGHRENDLVRLPDPTNVLKYPHIAMTGPAQRGYVVSASAGANPSAPWEAFDESVATNTSGWIYPTSGTHNLGTDSGSGTATDGGHWIRLELPHKLVVNRVDVISDAQNPQGRDEFPDEYAIYGWNGSGTWTKLLDVTGKNPTVGTSTTFSDTISNSTAYKHIALVAKSYYYNSTSYGRIAEIKYYGTGVDSIPIQIGGGNIDKVANFRVYNKFIDEDQALEIWDAQKDEFGRAKSSMTLQKGRIGLGTTEPEGRLAVADEPHNLEEFPPRAMTAEETHFEGHGTFKVALSSADNGNGVIPAFNKKATLSDPGDIDYIEWGSTQYTAGTGVYTGSVSTQGVSGEWIEIQMPYKIKLEYNLLYHRNRGGTIATDYWVLERMPRDGAILGSNDGETWTTLQSWTDFDWVTGTSAPGKRQSEYWLTPGKFVTNSTAYYKTFRLVFSKLFGDNGDRPNISEWRLFGTREQGQSVLHDGQLTLTKNLDVPRIGPALDSDDTPRRDRLVVEYNTSTNPTFEGAVRDTSGMGFDGMFKGTATYNLSQKDLTFPANSDRIETGSVLDGIKLQNTNTVSVWVKCNNPTAWEAICIIGEDTSRKHLGLWVRDATSVAVHSDYALSGNGGNYEYEVGDMKQWNHITVVRYGTSFADHHVYVNGTKVSASLTTGNSDGGFDLNKKTHLTLGTSARGLYGSATAQNYHLDGSLSNFKLYDVALTAAEVKTLYNMGRCDEGHHMVNFSKTRVGIGLGDGEAPTSTLDVRGTFQGNSPLRFYVVEGVHPSMPSPPAAQTVPTQSVDLPPGCIGSRIVSITGMTYNTNGDGVPFERHSEDQWAVDVYYSTYSSSAFHNNKFIISSQGSSCASKKWKMFVVTT